MGRDPREIPLILESLKAWRGMNARVGAETGFRQCGIIYLLATNAEVAAKTRWYEQNARPYGLTTRLISATEAHTLQPGAAVAWKGALYSPDDGRAEPEIATRHGRSGQAQRCPHHHQLRCARRGDESRSRQCCRNREGCHSLRCRGAGWRCVVAAVPRQSRVALPQLTVVNSVMRSSPIETGLEHSASGGKLFFRRRSDGGYTIAHRHFSVADILPESFPLARHFLPALMLDWRRLRLRFGRRFFDAARLRHRWSLDSVSPFETIRVLDPEPVDWILDDALSSLKQCYPAFEAIEIAERWAGSVDPPPTSFR